MLFFSILLLGFENYMRYAQYRVSWLHLNIRSCYHCRDPVDSDVTQIHSSTALFSYLRVCFVPLSYKL